MAPLICQHVTSNKAHVVRTAPPPSMRCQPPFPSNGFDKIIYLYITQFACFPFQAAEWKLH